MFQSKDPTAKTLDTSKPGTASPVPENSCHPSVMNDLKIPLEQRRKNCTDLQTWLAKKNQEYRSQEDAQKPKTPSKEESKTDDGFFGALKRTFGLTPSSKDTERLNKANDAIIKGGKSSEKK